MESPRSEASSDTTLSTSADSSSANPSPQQTIPTLSEDRATTSMVTIIAHDDSASDVSMSADTDDDDEDQGNNIPAPHHKSTQQDLPQMNSLETAISVAGTSRKRKFSSFSDMPNGQLQNRMIHEVRQRIKPDVSLQSHWNSQGHLRMDKSLLPAEIWHHIFTFCSPKLLGALLQVNMSFHAYLDPSSPTISVDALTMSSLKLLAPDSIWYTSRSRYEMPNMPAPLAGKSELDMWKLACGSTCQFCGKKKKNNPKFPKDQWRPGPGENGIISVWQFGIRTCGSCLKHQTAKEIDLLLSSVVPSPLMMALPFIFLTDDLHIIPPATLQSGQPPPGIQVTKSFSTTHVEHIRQDFEEVKVLGAAAAGEWVKGLDDKGKERKNDAARWERWEASGGTARMKNLGVNMLNEVGHEQTNSSILTAVPPPVSSNGSNPAHQISGLLKHLAQFKPNQASSMASSNHGLPSIPPRFDSPAQNGLSFPPGRPPQHTKHDRTKEEVAELKAARKAEIERRCMLLDPPITAGVLAHMASFQAAIQIIQPLADSAWEVLKPRLLSQREEAEQRESDRLAQTRVVQERFDERRFQEKKSDSKDLVDQEWDDIQTPLRARIGGYADEIIRDGWNGGEKVNLENCPLFASEVLIYVRKRFYAEVAKDEAAVRATGREHELDAPNGPFTRKLILENMKWVFDMKIKPHTEQYRKELFLCNACEYASKYYGFEGVIQHFAAKHTSALSVGSVVVHWKAEWPEHPPFNPDPTGAKPYFATAPSASVPFSKTGPSMQQKFGYGGYPGASVSAPVPVPTPSVYQESPGPYYGHPHFGDHYSGNQNGPYAPPHQQFPDTSQGYQNSSYSAALPAPNAAGYGNVQQNYPQDSYLTQYQPTATGTYITGPQPGYGQPTPQYDTSHDQQPSYQPNNFNQAQLPKTEEYKVQLQDIARIAREIWNSIGSMKDVPGSLKVYTVIYHLLNRFRATFGSDPPLLMIVDGLSNNKDMRPVRNVNGLTCKACTQGLAGAISGPQKKHYSFPQLVNHFHSLHDNQDLNPNSTGYVPDWTQDMVELPPMAKLKSVPNAPGMDEEKLKLFLEALPDIVATPESVCDNFHHEPNQQYGEVANQIEYSQLAPSRDRHQSYYSATEHARPTKSGSANYDNGEYDPRHPGDISVEPQALNLARRRPNSKGQDVSMNGQPDFHFPRHETSYQTGRPEPSYIEHRPSNSHAVPVDDYRRALVYEHTPTYVDRRTFYHEPQEVDYRDKREVPVYDEPPRTTPQHYRPENLEAYQASREELISIGTHEPSVRSGNQRPIASSAAQSRIFDVVAQISQQAQQALGRRPLNGLNEAGSEDGEVRASGALETELAPTAPSKEADSATERLLANFRQGEIVGEAPMGAGEAERRPMEGVRPQWEAGRAEGARYVYGDELQRHVHERYHGEDQDRDRVYSPGRRFVNPQQGAHEGYIVHERPLSSRQPRYAYDQPFVNSGPEETSLRGRSPELVDRRYKLNNVVYREERQDSRNSHRTPSRYARYESVRLENDRARSRSPPYDMTGLQPSQYRERSPAQPLHHEPVYLTRAPHQAVEEGVFERPLQEPQRIYLDDPRLREPQYAEAFEYVRVVDPQGDYMIRRVVRREPDPIYAPYEEDGYARPSAYQNRLPFQRAGSSFYEEYDPRNPDPLPGPARQVRYQ